MTAISSGRVPARDLEPGRPAPPGWMLTRDLAGLDDRALLGIVGSLPRACERSWPSSHPRWTPRWPASPASAPWPTASASRTCG
jgi:hypothetical protein